MGILENKHNIHLVGIGGIGMSALAEVLIKLGFFVSGSDKRESIVTRRLSAAGIKVFHRHSAENIGDAELIIYSSSVLQDNPEVLAANSKGIPIVRRGVILKELMEGKKGVAVSGAHGKTTVTSLVSLVLIESGLDPTVLIGADVHFLNSNVRFGGGEFFVTEADESDGTNLILRPLYCIATNIDKEHMDYFLTMRNVISSYRQFINNVSGEGCAILCTDDRRLKNLIKDSSKPVLSYGLNSSADISAKNLTLFANGEGSEFDFLYRKDLLGRVRLKIPGIHNIVNSLAAIGLGLKIGISFEKVRDIIREFKGAERRFKVTRTSGEILVIDDYAHHPTEISATLASFIKTQPRSRLIAAFQPHRYSRTRYLKEEFGKCFNLVDHLVITDIYTADESPIEGISGRDIYESVRSNGHKDVVFVPEGVLLEHLTEVARPGDAIFILGAGDIGELPQKLVARLNNM